MHEQSKLNSFMALRANGWSLARISEELDVPKSTLWHWDNSRQSEIHLLKHLQLERLQEHFLPSYEEELSQLRAHLTRVEAALGDRDLTGMSPQFLLQMSLQLRGRLAKMRQDVPLRTIPLDTPVAPLPFTGCVTRQNLDHSTQQCGEPEQARPTAPVPPENGRNVIPIPHPPSAMPNGNGNHQAVKQNGTFSNEKGRGAKNATLNANNLHCELSDGRTVLP